MADLILSPLIDVVTQKAIEFLKDQYELRSNVRDKLKKLESTLNKIKAVAATADVDRGKDVNLAAWAREMKNAALDADDVLDELEYMFLEKQAEKSSTSFLQSPFRYVKNSISYTALLKKLRGIQQVLEALMKDAHLFMDLVNHYKNAQVIGESSTRETSSSTVQVLIGRKDKLEEIVQALIKVADVGGDDHLPILPMVGLGGMGKTTLAQYVYKDSRIVEHFNVRMWVYVSQKFDVRTLTKKMIETASKGEVKVDGNESLETLQGRLKDALRSFSFLLVLDDMWYESENMKEKFEKLFAPILASARKKSKILVTSRTIEVGSLPGAMKPILLEGLHKNHCWSIIQRCCFNGGDVILEGHHNDLMEIGEQIADKVRGSPLAAKAVGGILKKKMNPISWKNILKTELSDLQENNIMPVLRLSYNYLSPHLRQCFAYCSLFPKGFHFDPDKLVRMWVAQGYIMHHQPPFGESTEEDVGRTYFDNLLSAGLFTRSEIDKNILIVMHDLVNDLARDVSKDDHLIIEKDILGKQSSVIPDTIRHLSINKDYLAEVATNMSRFTKVRSLIVFCGTRRDDPPEVSTLLGKLRRLRVLHISHGFLEVLPKNIACSVHLRYFDLSENWFGRLPSSLCKFYRLQVLRFEGNLNNLIVPEKVWDLDRLRYLATVDSTVLSLDWIGRQTSLQVFRGGRIKVEASRGDEELCKLNKGMSRLVEEGSSSVTLVICGIENLESSLQAKALADKIPGNITGLNKLVLQWSTDSDSKSGARPPCCDSEVQQEIFKALQPPPSIKDLTISYYKGTIGGPENGSQWFSPHLKTLWVSNCPNLNEMPSIPPHLKSLTVVGSRNLNEMPSVPPSLESLEMTNVGLRSLPELISGCPDIAHDADGRCNNTSMTATTSTSSSSCSCLIDVDPSSLLREIHMIGLGNLTSLRRGLLHDQQRLKHLTHLSIVRCEQLVSLPDGEFGQLVSLKKLYIYNCPNLIWAMPRKEDQEVGGAVLFPPSLEELLVSHIEDGVLSIRLQGLCNLSALYIRESPALTSLPSEQELAHLTSLRSLHLKSCKELTPSGMGGLRALVSLKQLEITGCPALTSSPNDGGAGDQLGPSYTPVETLEVDDLLLLTMVPVLKTLPSVKTLRCYHCNMKSLPAVLPSSLESLIIPNPHRKLRHKLRKDVGQDWHKIRHIRYVQLGSVAYRN